MRTAGGQLYVGAAAPDDNRVPNPPQTAVQSIHLIILHSYHPNVTMIHIFTGM